MESTHRSVGVRSCATSPEHGVHTSEIQLFMRKMHSRAQTDDMPNDELCSLVYNVRVNFLEEAKHLHTKFKVW